MTTDLSVFSETSFVVGEEMQGDANVREALLDRAMGEGRRRKSSEKLRCGRLPSAGLAFVARDDSERVIGSVRLWDVSCGARPMLLLGPLAVEPSCAGQGIGTALMQHAIARAADMDHGAIILVGDASYYARFGFSADKTSGVMMPGPVERNRLLGCELKQGSLDGASGLLIPRGRRAGRRQSYTTAERPIVEGRLVQVA
tara:strand:+ start:502 stop:1101 length:600 start_codon:yes stop_codon:yes gene_type:complete